MTVWIGIDPGQEGGIAAISHAGPQVFPMPPTERDCFALFAELARWSEDSFAVVEAVHSFPGQGVASSFTFGRGYGGLRMALVACGIAFEAVRPTVWQRALGVPPRRSGSKADHKRALRARAQELFPGVTVTLRTADALLIAEFNRRKRSK